MPWRHGWPDRIESTAEDPAEAVPATIADRTAQYKLRLPGFGDTAFSENHKRRLHRWVPWIAGFSSSFVTGVLDGVRRNGERLQVLDPFAGVGTTLVEAMQSGDGSIGFEINPYAALACRAKARVAEYDVDLLASAIERFEEFSDNRLWLNTPPSSTAPAAFKSRVPFFSPDVEPQVLTCLDFSKKRPTAGSKSSSNWPWGRSWLASPTTPTNPSLGTRAAAGKPNVEQADVLGIVSRSSGTCTKTSSTSKETSPSTTACLTPRSTPYPTWRMPNSFHQAAWMS